MFYNAMDQLVAVDARKDVPPNLTDQDGWMHTFDTYRYDALGRRVLSRSQRACPLYQPTNYALCAGGFVRRTVWDGNRELWEIKMPDSLSTLENDTDPVPTWQTAQRPAGSEFTDITGQYGRVGYVYGGAVDRPLIVLRLGYSDRGGLGRNLPPLAFPTFAIYPQWDARGEPAYGVTDDGGGRPCVLAANRCAATIIWGGAFAPGGAAHADTLKHQGWHGSLLEDKREVNGLLYRRNRYVDATTGRFTQPDPIGLAGGLNSYGFAGGDPVNFSDPFGTCIGPVALVCAWVLVEGIPASVIITAEVATGMTIAGRLSGTALVSRGVVGERATRNALIAAGETILAEQPSIRLANGVLRRADFLVAAKDGTRRLVESKFGGVRTAKQVANDAELLLTGGRFVGKNVPVVLRGELTGPIATEVKNVSRP